MRSNLRKSSTVFCGEDVPCVSDQAVRVLSMAALSRKVFVENRELYGCRKMRAALMNEGLTLSEWKIRRIMREYRAGHKVHTKMKCTCPAPKFMLAHKLPHNNSSLTGRAKATDYTAKT